MKLCMTILALCLIAPQVFAADGPTPYPDVHNDSAWPGKGPIRVHGWMVDNRNYFWTQRQKDQGAVVFVGDSLVGGWKPDMMAKTLPGLKVANRGIGGDVSRGVLFRFREDVLDLNPAAVVMCVGTNDLSAHADPAATEANLKDMIKQAREHNAALPIVVCLIPPREHKDAPTKPGAQADLNARISKLADEKGKVAVVDLFTLLADAEGKPTAEYFSKDRLHLSTAGYQKWGEALKPVLESLGIK